MRNKITSISATLLLLFCLLQNLNGQQLYTYPSGAQTRWIDFENRSGTAGKGAMENGGAKGHPSEWVKPGERITLMDFQGTGIIKRIWMTVIDRSPEALRSLYIEMYWDHAQTPAVSAPLGDFFGIALGRTAAFQSALFSNPEGKSFNCYIPMPFKKSARVVLINKSDKKQLLFYDIDMLKLKKLPRNFLYFHAYWNENIHSALGEDFEILPKVLGRGRFLGSNIGVIADTIYGNTWFGEGEVKIYLDDDSTYPTLAGTGMEDYMGTAWNLGSFANLYQGCPIVDRGKRQYAFYRYHVPDPVYFNTACRVTLQQMGGGGRDQIREILKKGGRLKVVSVMTDTGLIKLQENIPFPKVTDDRFPKDEWTNFYRIDHYSATAYFYLDKPGNSLAHAR